MSKLKVDELREMLESHIEECKAVRTYEKLIAERDALRAEVEKYKTAYENEESNKRMAQDASAAWSEDCEKLRAEVETLKRENESLKCDVNYSESLIRDRNTAIRERDEARAEVYALDDMLAQAHTKYDNLARGNAVMLDSASDVFAERDALRDEVETLKRELTLSCEGGELFRQSQYCVEELYLAAIRERDERKANYQGLEKTHSEDVCRLERERDEARAERDDALDKLRICGECATTLRKSLENATCFNGTKGQ